jgi:hypothetical protein
LHRGQHRGRQLGKCGPATGGVELAELEPALDQVLHLDARARHGQETRRLGHRVLRVGELAALGGGEEVVVGAATAEEKRDLRRELVVGERHLQAGRRRRADLAAIERARCEEDRLRDQAKAGVGALRRDARVEHGEQIDELAGGGRASERACRGGAREARGAGAPRLRRQTTRGAHDRRCDARDERQVAVELRTRDHEGARVGLPPVDPGIADEVRAGRDGRADDIGEH